ncbi:ATP-binding cassette domain-containing protein [Mycoplasma todarodis]|uniref:ATP-binding cassette domain-containing protein n=1 Tax=Mycoplasma todarodis TaxID=1937191 RepID=UPI003B33FE5C
MKTSNSNTLISIQGLKVNFGRKVLIENVDLEVKSGEMILLTGENGAGKTTLINYITGVKDSKNIKRKEGLQVSFTPQSAFLKGEVCKLIEKFAVMLGTKEIIKKVKNSFSLEKIWKSDYSIISSGEQQRVKMAIAFLRKPDLIILDEFSRGLDESTTGSFINLVKNLNKKFNIAIILISHNKRVIKELSKKHLTIKEKRLVEVKNV